MGGEDGRWVSKYDWSAQGPTWERIHADNLIDITKKNPIKITEQWTSGANSLSWDYPKLP
jgi:hypothetical protein